KEYKHRFKDSLKYEKELNELLKYFEYSLNHHDFNRLQKYLYERSKLFKDKTVITHEKKLKTLHKGPIGQDYQCLKTKLIHNMSSYSLSPAEERILCRGWEFYKQLYWRIRSTSSSLATMYVQLKIHKHNYPLRPIISSIGSYNHELSKYLAQLIKTNRPSLSNSCIRDSFDFVTKICNINNSKNQVMISFDVDSRYTNVPVQEAIHITLDMIFKRPSPAPISFDRLQLKQLLEISLCNIPFRFFK
ncbi:unnamed protein product, partial [Rotaria sp. Silwood1]